MCCLLPKNVEEFKLPNHCSLYSSHHLLFPCQCLRLVLFTCFSFCCSFSASLSRLISTTIHPSIALMPMNTINIIRIDQGDTDWVRTRTKTRTTSTMLMMSELLFVCGLSYEINPGQRRRRRRRRTTF